jgi:DNA polymerase
MAPTARQRARELEDMHERIRECTQCRLHKSRRNAVPGEGNPDADLMFIGEAPGAKEDETGRPFCGAAGDYFDEILDEAGIERPDVFITSSVKCRPPNNRNPRRDELETCDNLWLERQAELVDPGLIVLLGKVAARQVLGATGRLADLHGQVRELDGRRAMITYHPAAGMRFPVPDEGIRQDFRLLKELLKEMD